MAKRFSKSTETRDELQLPAILCQDACQRLMLHPYIRTSSQNLVVSIQVLCTVEEGVANACICPHEAGKVLH